MRSRSLPPALEAALGHVYGCARCHWRGKLIECLDAAEYGLLCPHCFAAAARLADRQALVHNAGHRYPRHRSAT
jgi:hypothetical protein